MVGFDIGHDVYFFSGRFLSLSVLGGGGSRRLRPKLVFLMSFSCFPDRVRHSNGEFAILNGGSLVHFLIFTGHFYKEFSNWGS